MHETIVQWPSEALYNSALLSHHSVKEHLLRWVGLMGLRVGGVEVGGVEGRQCAMVGGVEVGDIEGGKDLGWVGL